MTEIMDCSPICHNQASVRSDIFPREWFSHSCSLGSTCLMTARVSPQDIMTMSGTLRAARCGHVDATNIQCNTPNDNCQISRPGRGASSAASPVSGLSDLSIQDRTPNITQLRDSSRPGRFGVCRRNGTLQTRPWQIARSRSSRHGLHPIGLLPMSPLAPGLSVAKGREASHSLPDGMSPVSAK
ncbi:hypothetical protein CSOJ01_04910 [Colletotrichum sojae]|uniref:Uncharacterized protein n=1 Tax=Colletotrichum sojae TaxID=2175907 RepID=A0A8H6JI13_9PEZI|nr:hypothetical protein CSOJ01_04910 [Colletotrichum sojae]